MAVDMLLVIAESATTILVPVPDSCIHIGSLDTPSSGCSAIPAAIVTK